MYCMKCQNDLADCTCSDIQERLNEIAAGGHFVMRVCMLCGKHYAKCECHDPEWTTSENPDWKSRWGNL